VENAILRVLPRLTDATSLESKMSSLTMLMKLTVVDSSFLSQPRSHPSFDVVWSLYTGLLTDRSTTLAFKVCSVISVKISFILVRLKSTLDDQLASSLL